MKILINSAHQRIGGAIQVAVSFLNECQKFPEHEYVVCLGPGVAKQIDPKAFPSNFKFYHFDFGKVNLIKSFWINWTLRKIESKEHPDAIISHTGPSYFNSRAPQLVGFNLPVFIYPESPYVQGFSLKRRIKIQFKKKLQYWFLNRDATAFSVQTNDVNERISKDFRSKKVFTVTNNASHFYHRPKAFPQKLPQNVQGEFRFLTLTSYYPHKDLEILPKVVQSLEKRGVANVRFITTMKSVDFEKRIGQNPRITNLGPVPIAEAPSLYLECDGMFLPTLAECFSASYPEAMMLNKPIITTDLGFARSVCGNAALYFTPCDADAAADKIIELLNSKELHDDLVKQGQIQLTTFDTPEQRAEKYLDICKSLTHSKR